MREEIGLTQERLAWDCDLTKGYLCQIEAGRRLAALTVLDRIAERLGVGLLDVVAGATPDTASARAIDALRTRGA
ncbi:MAG: helix-turn-helix transcriptional regulator [Deltaproteobacteria bacterium]|nr:helix-turn-helix transcriptional regulator [Deltaproteobacteria bacterium]